MENESEILKRGAPWKHNLEIKELGHNQLNAKVGLAGEPWFVIISAVLFLIGLGLLGVVWITFPDKMGVAITAGIFAGVLLFLGMIFLGCYSYIAELVIDESDIRFERCFFWSWKRTVQPRNGKEFIQCWNHVLGTGAHKDQSFNVCLHMAEPLPVICLYSVDYRSNIKNQVIKATGIQGEDIPLEDDALVEVLDKADEIAKHLKIEHKKGE